MDTAERTARIWTAEEFLATDQAVFGDAWRYELVEGVIVAHAAPAPDHGAIVASVAVALSPRLRGNRDRCRIEAGSGAVPKRQQRPTARIPDVMIRCGQHPRVLFEVVSPWELRSWRTRDLRRKHLQDVEGVQEIVELYQREMAVHIYRKQADGSWLFEAIAGEDAVLRLPSVDLSIPLPEIYETVDFDDDTRED